MEGSVTEIPMPISDSLPQARALRRIRALSWPLLVLISIALGAFFIVATLEFVVLLGFTRFGSLRTFVSFGAWGVGVTIGDSPYRNPGIIPVDGLTTGQRLIVAGLVAPCAVCSVLAFLQLRGLFALYSRGVVFSMDNVMRIKKYGFWLAVTAIVANVAGHVFVRVLNAPLEGVANAVLAVVVGAMIYVIGYVMQLAREADLERKEFV